MNAIIGTIVIISYLVMLVRMLPAGKGKMDVFERIPLLLPYWWKFVGIGWLLFVFAYSIFQGNIDPSKNTFLLSGIYFGLLQIAFSKEKDDDEFAEQIRMKVMYISIISFFILAGIYSAYEIIEPNSFSENAFIWFMMLLNATYILYLSYFYFTKYRTLKNQN